MYFFCYLNQTNCFWHHEWISLPKGPQWWINRVLLWPSRKISPQPLQCCTVGRLLQLSVFITRRMLNESFTLALQTSIICVWLQFLLWDINSIKSFSLFSCVKVRLHHIHKVLGCFVSISRHVNDGERFAHSEEVHLLCVTLKRKDKEKTRQIICRYGNCLIGWSLLHRLCVCVKPCTQILCKEENLSVEQV